MIETKASTHKRTNKEYRNLRQRGDAKELFERQQGMKLQTFMNGKEPIDYSYQTCFDTVRGSRFIGNKEIPYHNEKLFQIFREIVDERLESK